MTIATLDFAEIATYTLYGGHYATNAYSEEGFTFTSVYSNQTDTLWSPVNSDTFPYYGMSDSLSLSENYGASVTTLTSDDGHTFGMISARGQLLNASGTIVFVATFEDGSTQTFTYTVDGNLDQLDAIDFPDSFGSGITQVVITSSTSWWTLDDLVLLKGEAPENPPGDTTPPGAPTIDLNAASDSGVSGSDNLTNDTMPTVSGTAEAGSLVTVYDGSTVVGTATAGGGGSWTLTLLTALGDGAHSFTATATDGSGNVSLPSAALVVTVDTATTAPALDLDAASDSGVFDSDDLTNDSTPALSGTAEAGSVVIVRDGLTEIGSATADDDGNWSLTLAAALADGVHGLTAMAIDDAGNASGVSTTLSVAIDTVTPDPTIASTSPDSDTTPTLAGTAEAGARIGVRDGDGNVVGTTTADSAGNWSFTLAALADGDHDFSATATDAAGNVSNSVSTTVSVAVPGVTLNGGNGRDFIEGTEGRDTLSGGNGADTISGNGAPDLLYGNNGDDLIDGGSGDDLINGGRGHDVMTGGAGADLFIIGKSDGNDTITDFEAGTDSLVLIDGLTVTGLSASGDDTLVTLSNGGILTLANVSLTSSDDLFV